MPVGLALPAVLRLMLALVLTVWALTKVADRGGPHAGQASFGVPVRLRPVAARLIPVLAMGVGIGLLPATSAWPAAIGAFGLLIVFALAIVANLVQGRSPQDHCFGQLSSATLSWRTVRRNSALIAGTIVIAVRGPAGFMPGMVARLSLPEARGLAAVAVIVGIMSIEILSLAGVLRQNGRLLLRLEVLEAFLGRAGLHARHQLVSMRPSL